MRSEVGPGGWLRPHRGGGVVKLDWNIVVLAGTILLAIIILVGGMMWMVSVPSC